MDPIGTLAPRKFVLAIGSKRDDAGTGQGGDLENAVFVRADSCVEQIALSWRVHSAGKSGIVAERKVIDGPLHCASGPRIGRAASDKCSMSQRDIGDRGHAAESRREQKKLRNERRAGRGHDFEHIAPNWQTAETIAALRVCSSHKILLGNPSARRISSSPHQNAGDGLL